MMNLVPGAFVGFLFLVSYSSLAVASEPPPPPPPTPKPAKPSGLTGNLVPFCEIGTYPAGNKCKPAPPGFYAPPNAKYPIACPSGMTSPYGSRGPGECKSE